MLISTIKKVVLITLTIAALPLAAQVEGNVILKAMKDELKRSMEEIKYENHDKPFFISYGITDSKNFSVYATLGAIVQSGEFKNRDKSARVLVGNYEFNDESLDNNLFSETTANEIQLPLDDDYFGIRRALWTTTDVVYKGAAQKYKKHQSTLKEQRKTLSDMPHRAFAKVPVTEVIKPISNITLDTEKLNDYCRQVSAVFRDYPEIESSNVMMNISYGTKYFVNSEGTVVVEPYTIGMVQCRAEIKTENGEPIYEGLDYYASSSDELPSLEKFRSEAKALAEKLYTLKKSATLEEDYSGPVLFLDASVADVFASTIFSQRESLIASNAILSSTDYRPAATAALDSRIGKPIMDNAVTVQAKPKLKELNGITVIGSYDVDDEGVVPPDQLMLIEKGVLKNLLNDRSLTTASQSANGHSNGPAVIEVSTDKGLQLQALKDELIALARKEGHDFALIARGSVKFGEAFAEVWKVNLDSGKEELLRSVQIGDLSLKNLKRIPGAAATQRLHTVQSVGGLASFIVPQGLLLEDIDVSPIKLPYLEEQDVYVQNPLKK